MFPTLRHAVRRPLLNRCIRCGYATKAPATQTSAAPSTKPPAGGPPKSSCTPNTILEGVNYLKGQQPVVAQPDEEYPEWLWTILSPKVYPDDGPGGKAERVQRRRENKQRIKDQNFMKTQ
ncbi:hypothetical protein ONZ45_g5604 [Pleurotus djamor]|nr:hypothetical protein ONZ45_g15026 [Pleurotus djamor]KAJ8517202.1 hypothetical protein ONZ45_g5604 [Pleurotus djamor]